MFQKSCTKILQKINNKPFHCYIISLNPFLLINGRLKNVHHRISVISWCDLPTSCALDLTTKLWNSVSAGGNQIHRQKQISSCRSQQPLKFTFPFLVFSSTQQGESRVYIPSVTLFLAIATWNLFFWRRHKILELEVVACFDFLFL